MRKWLKSWSKLAISIKICFASWSYHNFSLSCANSGNWKWLNSKLYIDAEKKLSCRNLSDFLRIIRLSYWLFRPSFRTTGSSVFPTISSVCPERLFRLSFLRTRQSAFWLTRSSIFCLIIPSVMSVILVKVTRISKQNKQNKKNKRYGVLTSEYTTV